MSVLFYKKWVGFFLAVLIGLLNFFYFFDTSIIDPSNNSWLLNESGDLLQNYLGGVLFRMEEWQFPLTKVTAINYPEGISIVYTDSNTLLSIITKSLLFFLPATYQYNGIWYLVSWVLLSIFSYLTIYNITKNIWYSLIGAVLCLLSPSLLYRVGHVNLTGHWLIMTAFYLLTKNACSQRKIIIYFWLLALIASMVHGYLFFMVGLIFTIYQLNQLKLLGINFFKGEILFTNIISGIIFIFCIYCIGYFYNAPNEIGKIGYGEYSMNLNALINPMFENRSRFFEILPFQEKQYEGYNYMGAGVILLLVTFMVMILLKKFKLNKLEIGLTGINFLICFCLKLFISEISIFETLYLIVLFQFFICCYIYVVSVNERFLREIYFACATGFIIALSLYIYIGDTSLIAPEISEDFSLNFIFQKIRSSGRFFWVSYYGFILIAIYFFSKHLNIKIGSALLIIAAVLQSYDLSKIKVDFNSDTKRPYTSDSIIARYLNNKKNIQFIYCFDMHLAKEALLDNKKVNNFYMAHNLGRESAKRFHSQSVAFKKNKWDANSLYVLEDFNFLPDNKLIKAEIYNKSFLIINQNHLSNNYLQIKFDTSSLKSFYENIDKYSTIALAVRDEASNKMPKWYKDSMYLKFGSKISELKFRGSYTALIDNNKLLNEQIKNDTIASINYNSGGLKIELVSAGLNTGDYTKIKFNNFNFSLNKRGINAVAIDKNGVYHLFHWDTYENNY